MARGPGALKLKDIAAEAGVTAGNILHHFGTIEGVQRALIARMARDVADKAIAIAQGTGTNEMRMAQGLDALFAVFADPAAARLAGWLALREEADSLEEVQKALTDALDAIQSADRDRQDRTRSPDEVRAFVITGVITALGAGLFGPSLSTLVGEHETYARDIAREMLRRASLTPPGWTKRPPADGDPSS